MLASTKVPMGTVHPERGAASGCRGDCLSDMTLRCSRAALAMKPMLRQWKLQVFVQSGSPIGRNQSLNFPRDEHILVASFTGCNFRCLKRP